VTLKALPAVAVLGRALKRKLLGPAGPTLMLGLVALRLFAASATVMVWLPLVSSVTLKAWLPLSPALKV
jgi:hypothetical protein